jgi:hypothetical protein
MTKLGTQQLAFLEALRTHNVWQRGGGWEFLPQARMTKLARSLDAKNVPVLAIYDDRGVVRIERYEGMIAFLLQQREMQS